MWGLKLSIQGKKIHSYVKLMLCTVQDKCLLLTTTKNLRGFSLLHFQISKTVRFRGKTEFLKVLNIEPKKEICDYFSISRPLFTPICYSPATLRNIHFHRKCLKTRPLGRWLPLFDAPKKRGIGRGGKRVFHGSKTPPPSRFAPRRTRVPVQGVVEMTSLELRDEILHGRQRCFCKLWCHFIWGEGGWASSANEPAQEVMGQGLNGQCACRGMWVDSLNRC